jgi:hypothetical protein
MTPVPDIDAFEERAAVMQYDGGLSRSKAEDLSAQSQGFLDASHYWQVLADYVLTKKLGGKP